MEDDLISIIVPIYNVEKYIKKCIGSLIDQTYKKIEILLIDDGSPDKCGIICDEFAEKDDRIKVIHQTNGGLSDARNTGLNESKGKYIVFVDSDDYVEKKYVELLYKTIIKNNVQISQCGINKFFNDTNAKERIGYEQNLSINSKQMMLDLYDGKWENIVVWNKMYSKKLFENIRFPKGKIHEDEFTTYKLLFLSNEIAIISDCLYNYRQTNESIMGKKYNIKRLDVIDAMQERLEFYKEKKDDELYKITYLCYLNNIKRAYFRVKENIKDSNEIQENLKKIYKEKSIKFLKEYNVNFDKKIKICLFYKIPNIAYIEFLFKNYIRKKKGELNCKRKSKT